MKRQTKTNAILLVPVFMVLLWTNGAANTFQTADPYLITKDSVGDIKVGSTIGDVRKKLGNATFTREADEGHDVIDVKQEGKTILWLSVQSKDSEQAAPITDDEKVFAIEVVDPRYKTADGIGVGTLLKDASAKYGNLKHIWVEGLTGNEIATFWKHPKGLGFQVVRGLSDTDAEKTAGIYVGDNNRTVVFNDGSVIASVKLSSGYDSDFLDDEINLITASSAGDIRIGMTVSEARAAIPNSEFKRSSDGEGIALISVSLVGKELMTLYAGEEDGDKPIDDSAKIEFIEVWDESYQTKEGVTPKMLLKDAEQIYGRVRSISFSEIESRATVSFERQPAGIAFRVMGKDSETGIYGDGRTQTDSFDPGVIIFSIQISRMPKTTAPPADPAAGKDFLIKDASPNFELKISIGGCDGEICEGPAMVQILRKGEAIPFQTASMENMFLELGEDQRPTANLIELYGMNNSGVVFDDFDFDGHEDIALRNGNNGAYSGPSYDVFLYSDATKLFVRNAPLTELASENLGLFSVDKKKKQIETFTKSGCCWHQTTRYSVRRGIPRKVFVLTEDAMGPDGKVVITTETLVNGVWKKTVKTMDADEN